MPLVYPLLLHTVQGVLQDTDGVFQHDAACCGRAFQRLASIPVAGQKHVFAAGPTPVRTMPGEGDEDHRVDEFPQMAAYGPLTEVRFLGHGLVPLPAHADPVGVEADVFGQ